METIDILDETIWKPIVDYEGLYVVNRCGDVYSIPRKIWNGRSFFNYKGKKIHCVLNHKGYPCVYLSKNGKDHYCSVHRLVAMAFIPNPNNYPQVNHINGIKTDNRVENPEWCTNQQNQIHAWKMGLQKVSGKAGKPKRKVLQIEPKTKNIIAEYPSISLAAQNVGCKSPSLISECCKNKYGRKTIEGYEWKYKEVIANE